MDITAEPNFWAYDLWPSGEPYEWMGCDREKAVDQMDFHVDVGCGTIKKGRIGIDRFPAPGVNVLMDLNELTVLGLPDRPGGDAELHRVPFGQPTGLPFPDSSIESIISHHALEHIGTGFVALVDEIYRVLKPDAIFRAITPLFPSRTAVEDPDHIRYFMAGTWQTFCGTPTEHWMESFSVPYARARFELLDQDLTPPVSVEEQWGDNDAREIRATLRAVK